MKLCQALAGLALVCQGTVAAPVSEDEQPEDHHHCCSALAEDESLRGKVLAKDSAAYDARLETYYSANSALPAWCMVMPESTQDVSRIASIFFEKQCPFGIRSGSHSAFKLSNGVEHGITVDFSYMNSTTYDADKKIAGIQPGSQWEAVYKALEPHGVAASGARASVVGVGGFTTGGGYTFHTNAHGFSCDSVANWEIVLADGTVVNANENENPDLWKAQKGASGNLGFITRIDQHVVESTQVWGGFVGYDLAEKDAVFDAYINFAETMGDDPASQEILCLYYDPTGFSMKSILTNTDAIDDAPAFEEFRAIPNISTTAETTTIAEMVVQFAGPAPPGQYANWFTGTTTNDVRVMKLVDEKLHEYVDKMKAAAPESEFNVLIQFQPITQSIVDHGKAQGGNIMGLEPYVADGPLLNWLIVLTVDTPENQEKILPLGIEYRDALEKETAEMGVFKEPIYLNYAWKDQNPIASYGAENIAFLKETAAKWDPQGVFQKLRLSGFKIPV